VLTGVFLAGVVSLIVGIYALAVGQDHFDVSDSPGGQPPFKHPCPGRPQPKAPEIKGE
jgi:hypothetical protein